jgi:hypothetical protein
MTRRRFIQQPDGELVEVDRDYRPEPRAEYHVMGDIAPYKSMIDGSMISSRSRHREHLKQHGCVEVGNDSSLQRGRGPLQSPPGLKETIARNVYSKLRY